MVLQKISICALVLTFVSCTQHISKPHVKTNSCEFYNGSACENEGGDCTSIEHCEHEIRNHCFVIWKMNATGEYIQLKGCFTNNVDCYDQFECVERREKPTRDVMFCCCEGDMCNRNFTWDPTPSQPPNISAAVKPTSQLSLAVCFIIPVVTIGITLGVLYCFFKHRKMNYFNEIPTSEPHPLTPPSPDLGLRPIQLIEIKARGRFGAVWKAQYKSETVAVKIFPIQDKQSWLTEKEIFKLPHMNNPDILQFIGVEKRGDNLQAEFWLVTAFHEKGSLCDYLKANVISWLELCRIAESISRGLMFLHDEVAGSKGEGFKPAIAHRDFKSKNVLLKSDMSACIADFGLALMFYPNKPCGDTHGQVGTRRYMAPEVLEGAIHFSRDAFLRIDMYACGLVLWELVSRCTAQDGPISEYMLPFEEEVGQHPSLEDMQECVVNKKQRPVIRETWRQHPGLTALCDTMEECWDHDAEARLSASCVVERVSLQSRVHRKRGLTLLNRKKERKKTPKMGYSGSRARCVPLQYPSNATRGVKQALNKKPLNQNIIALPTPLQERKTISDITLNSLNKDSAGQVPQSESGMFFELSNRKRMECEKYQDCSWFQQSPMKSDCNNKLSPAETFDPFFDADEFDLPMQYANAQTSPWGDEYLEVFTDDIHLNENYRLGEKNKNFISDENFYTNYKGDDDHAFDSCNINFSLKKTDSIDSMKNFSLTNPAEVIPISYKERLSNSNYGLTKLDEVKSEIKQEVESCLSETSSYLMDSDDSDLNIGREEVVEEMNNSEDEHLANKKEVESSHQIKSEVQTDKVPSEYAVNNKSNNSINNESHISQDSLLVKSGFSKINNRSTVGKCDLNLDIPKLNFDPSLNINTPDLDFMDLVDYINAEMRQENPTPCNSVPSNTVCEKSSASQNIVSVENQTNYENAQQSNEKTPCQSSETVENTWTPDLKDNSTVDFNEVSNSGVSIAERIKTSAKRKTRSVKDLIDTEDEESCDSLDDDEDYDYREDIPKRRCAPVKRRTKSNLSESSGDGKRTSEDTSYRERRDKNNEASRRSRQNRKARERHMYETLEEEEKKNVKLKAEADVLEKQVTSLRQLLLQVVLRKGGAT